MSANTTRPGHALGDDERVAGTIRDQIEALSSLALLHPTSGIDGIISSLAWVAAQIERGFDPETGARK